jgi:hypothetical protein
MLLEDYKRYVGQYLADIGKVIILGGEPTLHPNLREMIEFNEQLGLLTTLFTNGHNLDILNQINGKRTSIKLTLTSREINEQAVKKIKSLSVPLIFIFLLKRNNVNELLEVAKMVEFEFGCQKLGISNIRDTMVSGDYWKDTPDTLPFDEYAKNIERFLNEYDGDMEISISGRGVLYTPTMNTQTVRRCRYGSIFPNGETIVCPLDIDTYTLSPKLNFVDRVCDKHTECVLRKIILKRIK